MRENLAATLRLLLVTDDAFVRDRDVLAACQAAVRGGVTAVQLRLKHAPDAALVDLARQLIAALAVPVFVNDRIDVALAVGAAGAHLGPDDLSPRLARGIVPADFIIGASVGSAAEIDRGSAADYWGIGPLRATATKRDAGAPLGLDGVRELLARAGGRPCVVIGGVRPEDVIPVRNAGFAGVAVASGILASSDLEAAARRYADR
ncbi:MAG TPA: thiamine phosphate synthase [Gemmatimonadales bacterium]|jgi:thiamine-phosphate pyrophosphorylase